MAKKKIPKHDAEYLQQCTQCGHYRQASCKGDPDVWDHTCNAANSSTNEMKLCCINAKSSITGEYGNCDDFCPKQGTLF